MGKGFLFEKRQRRFTFNDKNFYLDLVLYNRFLRCYVLIDFKVDELTHQDLGQMQMYVNYYDRYEVIEGENPSIGILMCKQSDEALVELTLPENSNIYAKEYKLYLPDKRVLKQKLQEWCWSRAESTTQSRLETTNIGQTESANAAARLLSFKILILLSKPDLRPTEQSFHTSCLYNCSLLS